jgi:hypothetical protein
VKEAFSSWIRCRLADDCGGGAYVKKPTVLSKPGLAVRKELDKI